MLKDNTDYEYTFNKLKNEIDTKLILQNDIMESKKMNESLLKIENNLNILYEKTRYLEDIIDYAKTFLSIKIDNYSNEISSNIKAIEDISKINKNLGYIDYNVPFIENVISVKDRNTNYKIEPCSIKNNNLTLSNRIKNNYTYNSIKMYCEQVPHINNINTIVSDKFYRSIYLEEKPIDKGIIETLVIHLKEPVEINELNIKPVNCVVKNIRYVYINGLEENSGDLITGNELETRIVTHIKIDLVCTNYNIIQYTIDKEAATNITFDSLKEFEYPTNNTEDKLTYESIIKKTEYNNNKQERTSIYYSEAVYSTENTTSIAMYNYNFGLDSIEINRVHLYEDNYFISDPINIGAFDENEYIQLYVEDNVGENSCIEYYIVDGDIDIPIMPLDKKYITNERIFPESDLMFTISESLNDYGTTMIKKNGIELSISLNEAKTLYDARYCISYTPNIVNTYTPLNNTIRIKAIIRTFGDVYDTIPYISLINIRKFGGKSLWTNLY